MKKKLGLSIIVICGLNLLATSALADSTTPPCSYDSIRTQGLVKKGDARAAKAKALVDNMLANAKAANDAMENGGNGFAGTLENVDKGLPVALPTMLRDEGKCLVVIPSEKTVNLFLGFDYGRGVEYCDKDPNTGLPDTSKPTAFVQLEGLDIGPHIGPFKSTDLVLFVSKDDVNARKVKVSAEASAEAIYWGRDVSAGVQADSKIKPALAVSYSKSKGLMASATVSFDTIAPDKEMNDAENGKVVSEGNPFMRWIHSGERKKDAQACAARDQLIADANSGPAIDTESDTLDDVLPEQSVAQVSPAAMSINTSVSNAKPNTVPAPGSAPAAAPAAQAGSTVMPAALNGGHPED